jgi:hypothetical protein
MSCALPRSGSVSHHDPPGKRCPFFERTLAKMIHVSSHRTLRMARAAASDRGIPW